LQKTAIVTGLTGQDGSILAELLLKDGYKVFGFIRRSSRGLDLGCAANLEGNKNLEVVEGDLTDLPSLLRLCKLAKADLFFNEAAQSHVGTSFEQPIFTAEVTGVGVINCLEAIRQSGIHTKFLQASTSELFGGMSDNLCNEESPFHPRSPYGVAKLFGFWACVNYRESYKIFACNSISFNHECFFPDTPIIIRRNKEDIDIVYVSSLVTNKSDILYKEKDYSEADTEIWDGEKFVKLILVSKRKIKTLEEKYQSREIVNCRGGCVDVTPNHKMILQTEEKTECFNLSEGDILKLGTFPPHINAKEMSLPFAEFLGMLTSEGHIAEDSHDVGFSNIDPDLQQYFIEITKKCFCDVTFVKRIGESGFENSSSERICVNGIPKEQKDFLRKELYDKNTKHKKVPSIILNATKEVQLAFFRGYYAGDGLKKDSCVYEFKSFKSNSALLCQGLLFLVQNITGQTFNINKFEQRDRLYYQVNLHSDLHEGRGFAKKETDILKKKFSFTRDNEHTFVFNVETESGKLMAGVGNLVVSNSPGKRGPNFVTRKITLGVASIKNKRTNFIFLGNLDAKRDWSCASDVCKGQILMLTKSPEPKDYVLASGETHSVREFCEIAFEYAGLGDYQQYVKIDPRFFRPAEVDVLIGDSTKIRQELGWKPEVDFKTLVHRMVDYDLSNFK